MLHIIVLILKITGIILACIIGLVLLLLGLVLFAPVTYKGTVDFEKKPLYTVRIGWIPGVISVLLTNAEGHDRWLVKAFGCTVRDSAKNSEDASAAENKIDDPEHHLDESADTKSEPAGTKAGSEETAAKSSDIKEKSENRTSESGSAKTGSEETAAKSSDVKEKSENRTSESGSAKAGSKDKTAKAKAIKSRPSKTKPVSGKTQERPKDGSGISLEERWHRIQGSILKKLEDISEKFKALKTKKEKVCDIFFSPQGRRNVFKIKTMLIRLVKHVLPVRLSGRLYFGMGDAYKTASILTSVAVFYPVWSPTFTITPDFQEKVMEGHAAFKGRIVLGYVLWLVLKLVLDKQLRTMYKALKSLKA